MPNYPTTITSDAGPRGRGTYVHTCYSPMWCAHAGGIGDGCGGATTFTPPAPTPTPTPTPTNGITYCLAGSRVSVPAARPVDRVRVMRVAVALGATLITSHVNGTACRMGA